MHTGHQSIHVIPLLASLLLSCSFFAAIAAPASTRALKVVTVNAATRESGEVTLYHRSIAVIIGIDQYANMPADKQLTYAVKDAKGIADVLKRQYRVDKIITLYNEEATRKRILELLTEELPEQLGDQDALFIFWAGHGNQESSREGDLGYLIPHDGDIRKIRTNITMDEIRNTISKRLPAKHIFYVMDACYSGLLTETRAVERPPRRDLAYLQDITKERVRQVLTAGSKGQEVMDGGAKGHSIFTARLIELLENTTDFITANEIQAIIKEKVNGDARARNHNQTPSYGTLYGSGDFVFISNLEQKNADNRAEIAALEAELKKLDSDGLVASRNEAESARRTIEGKLRAKQIKQAQLTAENNKQEAEASARQEQIAVNDADEKRLLELRTSAEMRRKKDTSGSRSATVQSAATEIGHLNEHINAIEAGYDKDMAQVRKIVGQGYTDQLETVNKMQPDEFETAASFKTRQNKKRAESVRKGNSDMARLSSSALGANETAPLRERIKLLAAHEYVVNGESLLAELLHYDAETQQFQVNVRSKNPAIHLKVSSRLPLPGTAAKIFKQQWVAGLIRPEVRVRADGKPIELALVNDADNTRWIDTGGVFVATEMLPPHERSVRIENSGKLEMVLIPSGSFIMGSIRDNSDESPVRRVTFINAFAIGRTEITQAQWQEIMGGNPSKFIKCGDSCPVEQVSWEDVHLFIAKLNSKTGNRYRLPSEAEWEYACRGKTQQLYCGSDDLDSVGWYEDNSDGNPHPVANKLANTFGLYDMSGNVWEWVEDGYHTSYTAAPVNGIAWKSNDLNRVLRGGSWYAIPQGARATRRNGSLLTNRYSRFGFRLAETPRIGE